MVETRLLPDDCWESVITFLTDGVSNHPYLKSLSVVSKQFLSITNGLRSSLTVYNQTRPFLPCLFFTFTNLTSLNLTCFGGDLDQLLCVISCFRLNHLTSLNLSNQPFIPTKGLQVFARKITTLTSLTCSNIASLRNNDLVCISGCFPFLEELDLSNPKDIIDITDVGVKAMSTALLKLRKVNLSGHYYINDSLLFHLCENCEFLEEFVMLDHSFRWSPSLTNDGIASAISVRPSLRSLSIRWPSKKKHGISSHLIDSMMCLKCLTCLDFQSSRISDMLLSSIAMEAIPLRKLVLQNCIGYGYAGISCFLSKCQHIQHLDLQNAGFLTNQNVVDLSLFLGDLEFINLNQCGQLTNLALFALIRNCASLSEIKMELTQIGKEIVENSNSFKDFVVSPQLKSLHLAKNSCITDESIKMFPSMFPNLQLFDLSYCRNISEDSICDVLRRCCKIRHLNLSHCLVVNLFGMNFEVPKLEVVNLSRTIVNDETLYVISKSCCGLLELLLEECFNVTEEGVKHVLENCTKLREINLRACNKVNVNAVDSMLFLRPPLRKIIAPSGLDLSKTERIFLHKA